MRYQPKYKVGDLVKIRYDMHYQTIFYRKDEVGTIVYDTGCPDGFYTIKFKDGREMSRVMSSRFEPIYENDFCQIESFLPDEIFEVE